MRWARARSSSRCATRTRCNCWMAFKKSPTELPPVSCSLRSSSAPPCSCKSARNSKSSVIRGWRCFASSPRQRAASGSCSIFFSGMQRGQKKLRLGGEKSVRVALLNERWTCEHANRPTESNRSYPKGLRGAKVRTEKLWQKIEDLDAAIQAAQRTQAAAKAHQEERDSK